MGGDAHPGISDKAVASAAKALFVEEEYGCEDRPDIDGKWLNFASVRDREQYRRMARAALEAAAPRMLAEAWEQGMEAMHATTSSEWPPIPEANPYRPTP